MLKKFIDFCSIDGIKDAEHDQDPGKIEFKYELNQRGKELGLTQRQIANAVRTGYLGLEVSKVNLSGERSSVRLIIQISLEKMQARFLNCQLS